MLVQHLCSIPCLLQVFSREELELIADLCVKHDVLCLSDEVYEWLVYDGKEHIRIGTENGLAELGCLLWVQHLQGKKWCFNWGPLEITWAARTRSSTKHISPLEVFCCTSASASKSGLKLEP